MDRLRQVFDRILECDGFGIIIAFTHKKVVYVEYGGKEGVIYRTYLSGDTPNYCAIIRTSHWSAGDAAFRPPSLRSFYLRQIYNEGDSLNVSIRTMENEKEPVLVINEKVFQTLPSGKSLVSGIILEGAPTQVVFSKKRLKEITFGMDSDFFEIKVLKDRLDIGGNLIKIKSRKDVSENLADKEVTLSVLKQSILDCVKVFDGHFVYMELHVKRDNRGVIIHDNQNNYCIIWANITKTS